MTTGEREEQIQNRRNKRNRVQRMKSMIVWTISLWMIISMVLLAFLTVKVISLQHQVNVLSASLTDSSADITSTSDISDALVTTQNGTAESNLADADDTLKVYLTFDDGPSENTDEILDILDDYGVKATFFVVGKSDEESTARYQRIVNEGHTIGMHSYSHQYSDIYSSLDAFQADLSKIQNTIYDATGVETNLYRFPGGSSNKVSNTDMTEYIQYLNSQGITYYDWNVSCGDATSQAYTADELVENVMGDVVKYKTSVVLLHDADSKTQTVQALPKLIESLQSVGAMILPISDDTTVIQHVSLQTDLN
jgi:peptidoglycan/xylan/chitin deacetylase (PgdA/CDA1 family)